MRSLRASFAAVGIGAALLSSAPLQAQSLSDRFSELFTFGDCGAPLCLPVNADQHGAHYNPSVTQGEANLLAFTASAIGLSLASLPFTAATGGVTFSFEGGVPVATTVSSGPIYAERPQSIGRGRLLTGMNVSGIAFDNVRGVKLNALKSRFAHQNVGDPAMGNPVFENDYIEVTTDLDLRLVVTSIYASFGVTDRIDVSGTVPLVRASLRGTSVAQIVPYTQPSPHAFGTPENPSLQATSSTDATAVGIGDIAARAKVHLFQGMETGFAVVADGRFPTGDQEDFHGAGGASVRVLGIYGASYGSFSPHLNAGVLFTGRDWNDRLLTTLGFDQLVGSSVTLAGAIVTNFELGESRLSLPDDVIYTEPEVRHLALTDVPDRADHFADGSLGLKIDAGDYRLISNALIPLVDGGVRPRFLWTLGLERTF